MADKLQILIEALLAKTTKQQLIQELKKIEKGLKPIEVSVDVKAETQNKLFKSLQKIYKEEEKNRLAQERYSQKALAEKEKQLQYEQKVRKAINETIIKEKQKTEEAQKQIAIYKQELAIRLQNAQTSFGKHFSNDQQSAIISSADLITVDNYKNAIKDTNLEYDKQISKSKALRKEATLAMRESDNFMTTLAKDFGKMIAWTIVGTALFGTVRQIREGLDTLKELDSLMVDIAKVTNLSADAMKNLVKNSFDAASSYGRTAQDYLKAVAEFSRAGYEDQAKGLSEISLLAQNVGELTAEQANQFLLATDAAYKYSGSQKELTKVLDGVNEIDNKFATSIQKVSEGVTVAGSVAANAGVGIDELSAAVGTMTAVTQRSGNEAGRAFRSILMNIRQIKGETEDGEIIDDEALSKSAKALDGVDIKIHEMRNGIEELRNPMDVLKDLSNIWGGLSSMKQAPIIEALGGKLRGNQLIALLENFNMYEKMLTDYANAAGSAIKENEKRMDSWQSKLNQLTNTVSEYWNNAIDSDMVKDIIDLTKEFVIALDNVNQQFGVVSSSVYTLTSLLILFKGKALIGAITSAGGLGKALITLAANPMTLIVIGLGLLTTALIKFADETQKAKKKTEEINIAYADFNKSLNSSKIDDVTASLKKLTDTVDYEGATKKIAALNDEIDRLQNGGTNSRGKSATLGDRQKGRITQLEAERDVLQKQVDMVLGAEERANLPDNVIKRKSRILTPTDPYKPPPPNPSDGDIDLEKAYQSQYNIIRDLNFELDKQNELLSQAEDLDKIPILSKRNELLDQQKKNLNAINIARREEIATLKPTSERYQELVEKIQDSSLEWWKLDSAQKANLDTIKKINEEQEKNIENTIKEQIEIEKKLALQKSENKLKEDLLDLEQEVFGTTQDEWEKTSNARIEELEEELDLLDERADKEKESQERAEKLLEIQKQKDLLNNIKNNKDTRLLTDKGWEWVANPQLIADETETLRDMQTSYADWEEQNRLERKKRNIQDQIEEEKELQKIKKQSYDEQKKELETAYESEKSSIESAYFDIDGIVAGKMDTIKATHNAKLDELLVDAQSKLSTLKRLYEEALNMQSSIEDVKSSSKSTKSSTNNTSILGNIIGGFKNLIGLETGGKTVGEGLAYLHDKEIVLNKIDTENLLKAVDITRNLVQSIKLPQLNLATANNIGESFTIQNLNISANNGDTLDSLMNQAKQKARMNIRK